MDCKISDAIPMQDSTSASCQTSNQYALVPVSEVVDVKTSYKDTLRKVTNKYKGLQNQGAT